MVLTIAALLTIVLSSGLPFFILGLGLLGLGTGIYGTPRLTVLSDTYPDQTATAISVHSAFGNLGNAGLPVVATVVAGWFAWRGGIAISIPMFILITAAFWVLIPVRTSPQMDSDQDGSQREALRRILAGLNNRSIIVATLIMICLGIVWQGFTAFLPTYLFDIKGLSEQTSALALGAFFICGGVTQPVTGRLADQYGERRIVGLAAAGTVVALVSFLFVDSRVALLALSVLAGVQLTVWPILFAYVSQALSDEVQGSGFGLLRTLFLYIGAFGPILIGVLADVDLFNESMLLLAALTMMAGLLVVALPPIE